MKNNINTLLSHYFNEIAKDVTYQLKTPQKTVERQNLIYISPCFYKQHQTEAVIWHKVMTFEEYNKKFHPSIEDPLTNPEELVLVMVLDYVA